MLLLNRRLGKLPTKVLNLDGNIDGEKSISNKNKLAKGTNITNSSEARDQHLGLLTTPLITELDPTKLPFPYCGVPGIMEPFIKPAPEKSKQFRESAAILSDLAFAGEGPGENLLLELIEDENEFKLNQKLDPNSA